MGLSPPALTARPRLSTVAPGASAPWQVPALGYVLVLIVIVVGIGLVKAWHARKPAPQLQAPLPPPVTAGEPAFSAGPAEAEKREAEKSEEGLAPIASDEPAAVAAWVPEPSLDERLALSN